MSDKGVGAEKQRGGVVFFPREYVLDEVNPDNSYAIGMTFGGKEIVVYLNPDSKARDNARNSDTAQSIPRFEVFAETHRRAMHPCMASKDNCLNTPAGIMLLEQFSLYEKPPVSHSLPVYVSKWASVLRDGDDMPMAPIGLGYLEINFGGKVSDSVNEYMVQYKEIEDSIASGVVENLIDADEKKHELYLKIMSGRQKWFIAVILKEKEIIELKNPTAESFSSVLTPILNKYTYNGMYGGSLIRVRKDNTVISGLCCNCDMQFDYKKQEVMAVSDVISTFLKWDGRNIINAVKKDPSLIIEIIPSQRINCGKLGNDKYGKEFSNPSGVPKVMKTYVDRAYHANPFVNFKKEKAFLFSNVAVRIAEIRTKESSGNMLVSSIHAFSAPLGNAFLINKEGKSFYTLDKIKQTVEKAA